MNVNDLKNLDLPRVDPSSKLVAALSNVRFGTRGKLSIEKDAKDVSRKIITEMWNAGDLPVYNGKKWLVGFKSHVTFFSVSVHPIYVGPAKPSKFRERHSQATADRAL